MKAPPSSEHSPRPLGSIWAGRGASTGTLQILVSLRVYPSPGENLTLMALSNPMFPNSHNTVAVHAQQQLFQLGAGCSEKSADFTAKMCQPWKATWKQKSTWVIPSDSFLRSSIFVWMQGLLLLRCSFLWGTSPVKQDTRAFPLLLLSLTPLSGDKTTGMQGSHQQLLAIRVSLTWGMLPPDLCCFCKTSVVDWKIWSCVLISGFYYKCTHCALFWGPGFSPAWNCQD